MTILIPVVGVLTTTLFVTMVTKTDQNRLIGGALQGWCCPLIVFTGSEIAGVQTPGLNAKYKDNHLSFTTHYCQCEWENYRLVVFTRLTGNCNWRNPFLHFWSLAEWLHEKSWSKYWPVGFHCQRLHFFWTSCWRFNPQCFAASWWVTGVGKDQLLTPEFVLTNSEIWIKDRVDELRGFALHTSSVSPGKPNSIVGKFFWS